MPEKTVGETVTGVGDGVGWGSCAKVSEKPLLITGTAPAVNCSVSSAWTTPLRKKLIVLSLNDASGAATLRPEYIPPDTITGSDS